MELVDTPEVEVDCPTRDLGPVGDRLHVGARVTFLDERDEGVDDRGAGALRAGGPAVEWGCLSVDPTSLRIVQIT